MTLIRSGLRPSTCFFIIVLFLAIMYGVVFLGYSNKKMSREASFSLMRHAVTLFGISDLALSTEARYSRHPVASDDVVVTMDHPSGLDHFPSTLFWAPAQPER